MSNTAVGSGSISSSSSTFGGAGLSGIAIPFSSKPNLNPSNELISSSYPHTITASSGNVGSSSSVNLNANVNKNANASSSNTSSSSSSYPHQLVMNLTNPNEREVVLLELSKKRESFPDLAPILWHSFGSVSALLQEIVNIYPQLNPPTLTAHASNRVCNALALLQCVASHPDTRGLFLAAHIPLYLYPFLNTQSKSRPFEYLRLTSLGVIGALVKMDDSDVIHFLLQTEIIPLCLRIMETGSELSKTVATFIVQKILLDNAGLNYICATAERFYAVCTVLSNMVSSLLQAPSIRLLKHIVRCYLRLSDNVRAKEALRQEGCLPMALRDDTFVNALRDDATVRKWLQQLLSVVGPPVAVPSGTSQLSMQGGIP